MIKGKASVYVYAVPKDKWPKKVKTTKISFACGYYDYEPKTGTVLGFEFLDCYGVEINGRAV